MTAARTKWAAWIAFFLPLVVYIAPHRYNPSGDTAPAELLPVSILREHNLDFDEFVDHSQELPYYFTLVKGHAVSSYPILPGILNVPIFAAADAAGVDIVARRHRLSLLTAAWITSLSTLFLFLALREVLAEDRAALGFALAYALGTTAWSIGGITLFQHGASLLFLSFSFFALIRKRDAMVPWAGLALGLAVADRPTNIVFALPLAVFVAIHRRRRFPWFALLAGVPAALVGAYSLRYWGTLRTFGQQQGGWGFTGNPLQTLPGLLISPARGLLLFSPFLAVGLAYGAKILFRRQEEPVYRWLFACVVSLLLLYSWWGTWWGGNCYGYRLITEAAPALVLLSALGWQRWLEPSKFLRLAFLALVAFSVYAESLAVWAYPVEFEENIDREPARLWDLRASPITIGSAHLARRLGIDASVPRVQHTSPPAPPATRVRAYSVWWSPWKNDDAIPGWYDSPLPRSVVHGPLVVDGWARAESGNVDVRVILDDGERVATPERYPRPDAGRANPRLGDCSTAGFRTTFAPPRKAGLHTIDIEFRSPEGRARRLPTLRVIWGP